MCAARNPEPPKDEFFVSKTNYRDLLRVNKMIVSEQNTNRKDLFKFEKGNKEKFVDVIEKDMGDFGNIKCSIAVSINFKRLANEEGEEEMLRFFSEQAPTSFSVWW